MLNTNTKNIRNFAIISHIDHGKSTLADRILEKTKSVDKRAMRNQFLDNMELEREKGITIKLKPVRMKYTYKGEEFILNLIDTPGHVDFAYEVSRSLAACEGAVLLVDATKGIQAQTISNFNKARKLNLEIIPVINKIDSPLAKIEKVKSSISSILGLRGKEILQISAKKGVGIETLLNSIIKLIPGPNNRDNSPFRSLIFDSFYDSHLGVIAIVKIVDGVIREEDFKRKIKFIHANQESTLKGIGYLYPEMQPSKALSSGNIGFIATGLKDIEKVRAGDTLVFSEEQAKYGLRPLPGYKEPKPMVFLSFYPQNAKHFNDLKGALEKLKLNDAALMFSPETAGNLGTGFRCGFLGILHAEITQERLEREFDLEVFATAPSVEYKIILKDGKNKLINSASDLPDMSKIKEIQEPYVKVKIFTPINFVGKIMKLCENKGAKFIGLKSLDEGSTNVQVIYEMPLLKLITGFYDNLKSVSSGYASLDYGDLFYKKSNVIKLDILVAGEKVDALSQLITKNESMKIGREIIVKLKELIPKQQFAVSLQAAIGGKIIARETIPALRKNVLHGIYGGHRERKDKLLEKQRKGKKRLKKFGKVSIPQETFWKIFMK